MTKNCKNCKQDLDLECFFQRVAHCKVCHKLLYPQVKKVLGFDGLSTEIKDAIVKDFRSTTNNSIQKLYTLKAIAEKYNIKESTMHNWKAAIARYVQQQ